MLGFVRTGVHRGAGPLAALLVLLSTGAARADAASNWERATSTALIHARRFADQAAAWFAQTAPTDRIIWGGLGACAVLGLSVLLERWFRLRHGRALPRRFVDRFTDRLRDGQIDPGKGTDLCEMHPSPAARIALAAFRRWGRPVGDIERAVAMAKQVEIDRLRRNVGTLKRIAALAPLIGLLGALMISGRALAELGEGEPWGPAIAGALAPLTAGVALAILALVAYDGLIGRVEAIANALDRLGAETIDAIALMTPTASNTRAESSRSRTSTQQASPRHTPHAGPHFTLDDAPQSRAGRPIRVEIPESFKDY